MNLLAIVDWIDSRQPEPEWEHLDDSKTKVVDVVRVRTTGWIIKETKDAIVITQTLTSAHHIGARQCCGRAVIAKCQIVNIRELTVGALVVSHDMDDVQNIFVDGKEAEVHPIEFTEGYVAHENGILRGANPYNSAKEPHQHVLWNDGWLEAEKNQNER